MKRLVAILGCLLFALSASARAATLDDCDAAVRANPDDYRGYACYQSVAGATLDDIARRIEAHLLFDPENFMAMSYLGPVRLQLGLKDGIALAERGARGLVEEGNPVGATFVYLTLTYLLREQGRLEEAQRMTDEAMPLAESIGNPSMIARVLTQQASIANHRDDFGRALRLLDRAESGVFPDGPTDLKSLWLSFRAYAYWALGDPLQTMELYRREAALLRDQGDLFAEAVPRRNMAFMADVLHWPEEQRRELALEALEIARAGGTG